jgi:hypothetical protein
MWGRTPGSQEQGCQPFEVEGRTGDLTRAQDNLQEGVSFSQTHPFTFSREASCQKHGHLCSSKEIIV